MRPFSSLLTDWDSFYMKQVVDGSSLVELLQPTLRLSDCSVAMMIVCWQHFDMSTATTTINEKP